MEQSSRRAQLLREVSGSGEQGSPGRGAARARPRSQTRPLPDRAHARGLGAPCKGPPQLDETPSPPHNLSDPPPKVYPTAVFPTSSSCPSLQSTNTVHLGNKANHHLRRQEKRPLQRRKAGRKTGRDKSTWCTHHWEGHFPASLAPTKALPHGSLGTATHCRYPTQAAGPSNCGKVVSNASSQHSFLLLAVHQLHQFPLLFFMFHL